MNPRRWGALLSLIASAMLSCRTTEPVSNAVPSLFGLSPATVTVGGAGFSLTLEGEGFSQQSRARWNGQDRPTTFVSSTRLTMQIPAADIVATGSAELTVYSPPPGGGLSGKQIFSINNPGPTIASISPVSAVAPAPPLVLTVNGSGYVPESQVLVDGSVVSTTYVNSTQLTSVLGNLAFPGTLQISVSNPAPGGGFSTGVAFTIEYPVAVAAALEPSEAVADDGATTVAVLGSGFTPQSIVRLDGSPRTTVYFSDTRLTVALSAADIAQAGSHSVTVFNPTPGGGVSVAVLFPVHPAPPRVTSVSPGHFTAGAAGTSIVIVGKNFTAGTVVEWNAAARPTTFLGPTAITAAIPASDLAAAGTARLEVVNPQNGTRTSVPIPVVLPNPGLTEISVIPIKSNDVVYDEARARFYVSVPSGAPAMANTITAVSPFGQILFSIPVTSNPGRMALLGKYLYVMLNDAPAIARLDLDAQIKDAEFTLGQGSLGPLCGEDIEVLNVATRTVAVSLRNSCCSPRHMGVAIYDDGVIRPTLTQGHTGSNRLAGSGTPTALFGYNNETTEFGLRRLRVIPAGVRQEVVQDGLIGFFGADIDFADGRIVSTTGSVIDAATLTLLGSLGSSGPILLGQGRIIVWSSGLLKVFAHASLEQIGQHVAISAAGALTIVRWAPTALALRTLDQLVIVTSPLFGP